MAEPERDQHPAGAVAPAPDPGIRVRYLFTLWRSCADWRTRGAMLRLCARSWRRRTFGARER